MYIESGSLANRRGFSTVGDMGVLIHFGISTNSED